jgi:hypothetical protein
MFMKQSEKYSWNDLDTKKFFADALKVLAPYLIVVIPVLISQIPDDWAWSAIVLFLLQRARVAIELYLKGK